jgi:predicted metal-dependent HD superfamily phosphohydrolase
MFEPPQHVIDAYNEPHRKYHNLQHIGSILSKIPLFVQEYGLSPLHSLHLEILAWYHDVVYTPGNKMNEAASSNVYMEDRDSLPKVTGGSRIIDTIVKTGSYEDHASHTDPPTFIAAIFFDLDLADMGTDSYIPNSFKIREEFGEFSDLEWLAGRQKFLADFLSRPFIFHTSLGYKLWEEKARRNMENELHFLKGKYGF